MGVGAGLYMCDVVKKSSRSLSHLLMSSCKRWLDGRIGRAGRRGDKTTARRPSGRGGRWRNGPRHKPRSEIYA